MYAYKKHSPATTEREKKRIVIQTGLRVRSVCVCVWGSILKSSSMRRGRFFSSSIFFLCPLHVLSGRVFIKVAEQKFEEKKKETTKNNTKMNTKETKSRIKFGLNIDRFDLMRTVWAGQLEQKLQKRKITETEQNENAKLINHNERLKQSENNWHFQINYQFRKWHSSDNCLSQRIQYGSIGWNWNTKWAKKIRTNWRTNEQELEPETENKDF